MKTNLNLSISQPCDEKWENFAHTANGGFCGSCNKVVVDFTKMTDEKILEFFKNKPAHTCGRFRVDQMKTYSERPLVKINPGLALLKTGFLSLAFMLLSRQGSAQEFTSKHKTETVQLSASAEVSEKTTNNIGTLKVKGFVKSGDDGSSLPGVNILVKGKQTGTVSDGSGYFELSDLNEGDVLIFSFIGMLSQEVVVEKNSTNVQITMMMMYTELMGEVAVDDVYKTKSGLAGWWSKVKSFF